MESQEGQPLAFLAISRRYCRESDRVKRSAEPRPQQIAFAYKLHLLVCFWLRTKWIR